MVFTRKSYNKTVKDHTFGATALTSWTQSKYTSVNAQGEGQLVDSYLCPVIVKYCRNKIVYDKYLLMDGLWAIYQKNK